jgi:hypothetical protein
MGSAGGRNFEANKVGLGMVTSYYRDWRLDDWRLEIWRLEIGDWTTGD